MSQVAPGARSSRRRFRVDALAALAVALPLLTAGALGLVRPPERSGPVAQPPVRTALTSATLVCPSALPGSPQALLSTTEQDAAGPVEVRAGRDGTDAVGLRYARLTGVERAGPLTVTGKDELAPGLVGGRSGAPRLAASSCPAPTPDQWFTGVGAGATHVSTLELVNPDAGSAVAEVTVLGPSGEVDVARLRGVAVPGGGSVRLDLGAVAPRRGELALRVTTSRGRLAATVLDAVDELGAGRASQDWLPAQAAPDTDNLLLGLAPGDGTRTLLVANPGDDEVRVRLRIVSAEASFAPAGVEEIRVAPGSTERVSVATPLQGPLPGALRDGALGLQLTSSAPVTATLRTVADGDLSQTTASPPIEAGTAVVLPEGRSRLVLAGAETSGPVTVTGWTAAGRRVLRTRSEVAPDRGTEVPLPASVRLLALDPGGTRVRAGVLVTGNGATVLPLVDLVRNGLVPDVRPGLS